MGSFFLAAGLFTSPLLGLIFGLCVSLTVRRVLKKISEKEIINWTKEQFKEHKKLIIGVGVVGTVGIVGVDDVTGDVGG